MTLRILCLFVVLSISGFGAHAKTDSTPTSKGMDLYHSCRAAIRVMDSLAKPDDYHDSEFCRGYFTAFGELNDMEGTSICLGGSRLY